MLRIILTLLFCSPVFADHCFCPNVEVINVVGSLRVNQSQNQIDSNLAKILKKQWEDVISALPINNVRQTPRIFKFK